MNRAYNPLQRRQKSDEGPGASGERRCVVAEGVPQQLDALTHRLRGHRSAVPYVPSQLVVADDAGCRVNERHQEPKREPPKMDCVGTAMQALPSRVERQVPDSVD